MLAVNQFYYPGHTGNKPVYFGTGPKLIAEPLDVNIIINEATAILNYEASQLGLSKKPELKIVNKPLSEKSQGGAFNGLTNIITINKAILTQPNLYKLYDSSKHPKTYFTAEGCLQYKLCEPYKVNSSNKINSIKLVPLTLKIEKK